MKIKALHNKKQFDEYKELIQDRDSLRKEAFQWKQKYNQIFGDDIRKLFHSQLECIELKKKIAYCQTCINHGYPIIKSELESHIETIMQDYKENEKNLIQEIESAKQSSTISDEEYKEIKKTYRRIAKMIHPDLHPELSKNKRAKEIWECTTLAYQCNDLDELKNQEFLAQYISNEDSFSDIDHIEERISHLKEEIQSILSNEPYQYKYTLQDTNKIHLKSEEFQQSIQSYITYKEQLEKISLQFHIANEWH